MRTVDDNGAEQLHRVDDLTFTDHRDSVFSSRTGDDRILVMNYFFTSCPTICPKMTDNLFSVFSAFQDSESIEFVSVTVDPKRDDPKRLRAFMTSHDIPFESNWYFLTGEKRNLYDFARYQLYLSAMEDVENIEDDFIHSEKIVLIDPDRHIRAYYRGTDPEEMKRLKRDIRRIQKEFVL